MQARLDTCSIRTPFESQLERVDSAQEFTPSEPRGSAKLRTTDLGCKTALERTFKEDSAFEGMWRSPRSPAPQAVAPAIPALDLPKAARRLEELRAEYAVGDAHVRRAAAHGVPFLQAQARLDALAQEMRRVHDTVHAVEALMEGNDMPALELWYNLTQEAMVLEQGSEHATQRAFAARNVVVERLRAATIEG